jgi:hypothetical protein
VNQSGPGRFRLLLFLLAHGDDIVVSLLVFVAFQLDGLALALEGGIFQAQLLDFRAAGRQHAKQHEHPRRESRQLEQTRTVHTVFFHGTFGGAGGREARSTRLNPE